MQLHVDCTSAECTHHCSAVFTENRPAGTDHSFTDHRWSVASLKVGELLLRYGSDRSFDRG